MIWGINTTTNLERVSWRIKLNIDEDKDVGNDLENKETDRKRDIQGRER